MTAPPPRNRLILNVAAAQHELEAVGALMASVAAVVDGSYEPAHPYMQFMRSRHMSTDELRAMLAGEAACE